MSRPYTSSQRQPRSANLQVPYSAPQENQTLRQNPNYKQMKPVIQQPNAYQQQQRPQSTNKLRLQEQNSFVSESPLYNQLYSLNQNQIFKTNESFTQSPMINQSQDFSKLEITDLKEELVRKSNRIQQLLSNSEKRMQARSISPQSKSAAKNIINAPSAEKKQAVTPSKNFEQGQEIKDMLAAKVQELEKLKSKGNFQSNAQEFKFQFEVEKKKYDNITNILQQKVANVQNQASASHKPPTQSHSQTQQQLIQCIKSSPQLIEKTKKREKIQNPDLRRNLNKFKEEENVKRMEVQSSEIDLCLEKENSLSYRNNSFVSMNDNQENYQLNLKKIQKQNAKITSDKKSFQNQFDTFQNENTKLWEEVNQLQDQNEKNNLQIKQLKGDLQREKQQTTSLKNENQTLKQDKTILQDQIESQKTIEANISISQTPNKKQLEEKRRAEHFKELTDSFKQQLKNSKDENEKLQAEINKLNAQVSKSKQEKQTLTDKIGNLQTQVEELQNQINDFKEHNTQLQDNLRKQENENKQSQRS